MSGTEHSEDPIQEAILWAPDRECIDKVYDRRNGRERDVTPEEWAQFLQYAAERGVCLRLNADRFIHYDGRYYRIDGDPYEAEASGVARVDAVSLLRDAESVEAVLVEHSPFADDDPEIATDGGVDEPGIEREDVSVSADDGDAIIGVGGAEIRITVRTDGRKRSVELDNHGEGPYWLIVGEDEDGNEAIVGEMEPVFDPAEDGDRDE